jgi:DNA-binding CsgD family transcriptional regulator
MPNQPAVYKEAKGIWRNIAPDPRLKDVVIDLNFNKSLLQVFCIGDYYHFLFNIRRMEFDYVSPEMSQVLGYPPEQLNTPFFLSLIHEEDIPFFVGFEQQVVDFFNPMEKHRIANYKVRYDYRVKKAGGDYIRILHQMLTIIPDHSGVFENTFCVHTDITYLKKDGVPMLSFIGLQGEPSYVDVGKKSIYSPIANTLSQREKEVVVLLAEGHTSRQIADKLYLSTATVSTHRKNILKKTGLSSTAEVVASAINKGWI